MANFLFRTVKREEVTDFIDVKYRNFTLTREYIGEGCQYIESLCTASNEISNVYCVKAKGDTLEVENSFYFTPSDEELTEFFEFVWHHWYAVKRITFNTLLEPLQVVPQTSIHYISGVDNIAILPESFEAYLVSLGKQTCKHSKYYLGRIKRDFPSCDTVICMNRNIRLDDYQQIVELSRQRMEYKNKPYSGGQYEEHLYKALKGGDDDFLRMGGGILLLVKIESKIVAGCVGFLMGENFYLSKIAHNVEYNKYNLGNIALLETIRMCINQDVKNFHFLWGENVDYKKRFGGEPHPLHYHIFYKNKGYRYFYDKAKLSFSQRINAIKNYLKNWPLLTDVYHRLIFWR